MSSAEPAPCGPTRVFAALGDPTRLELIRRLGDGEVRSLRQLTAGGGLTRQAVSKHLHVLEEAGLVRGARAGRESLYALRPEPVAAAAAWLDAVSARWGAALDRLKAHVER